MTISKGVWFDSKAQKVVESEPEEGVQIVAPGSEETPNDLAEVQRFRDMESGVSHVETIGVEPVKTEPVKDEPVKDDKPAAKK